MTVIVLPLHQHDLSPLERHKIVETVCDWERIEYGDGNHRTPDSFFICIQKNDTGFFCAIEDGQLLGYADVWQLHAPFYESLASGVCAEEEIAPDHILRIENEGSGCWYIGSIITRPALRQEREMKAALVFSKICDEISNHFEDTKRPSRILGVGSTVFGNKLLRRHGFMPVTASPLAIDLRPRYEKSLAYELAE